MKKRTNSSIIALMAQMIAASSYGGTMPYMNHDDYRKRKQANIKRIAEINRKCFGEKPLSKFIIKGHEVEAYSRKDAIVRLKHKGLL